MNQEQKMLWKSRATLLGINIMDAVAIHLCLNTGLYRETNTSTFIPGYSMADLLNNGRYMEGYVMGFVSHLITLVLLHIALKPNLKFETNIIKFINLIYIIAPIYNFYLALKSH